MAAPVLTGTPVALALGTSATPGAQSITVPSDAQLCVVAWCMWEGGSSGTLTSLASTAVGGGFTRVQTPTTANNANVGVAYGLVTATGSQTVTPTWNAAIQQGPEFCVVFVKGVDTAAAVLDAQSGASVTLSGSVSLSLTSATDALVLQFDTKDDQTGGATSPGTPSGWTSLSAFGGNQLYSRLSSADTPGASTTTATTQATLSYSTLSAISIKAAPPPAPSGPLFDPAIFSAPPFDTGAGGGGGSPYTAEITPATYTATAASITALQKRLAATTAASYTTAASQITANVGRLAGITPAGYATTYSMVEAIYGGGLAAYLAEITPASYTTTAASIEGLFFRRAEVQPAAFATTAQQITGLVARIGDVTPASYGTTPASITAAAGRLAGITPAGFTVTASQVGALRTALADVSAASYGAGFTLITADYSGLPPPVAADGLAALLRRRRR
jgi:hypothetical protein